MKKQDLTTEQVNAVLQALNTAIAQGPWSESNFLKVIGKHLTDLRNDFMTQVKSLENMSPEVASHLANQREQRNSQKKVYVALYSSNGKNIQSWEWIVTNLPRQMVSRPVYLEEDDIQSIIKTKENKANEAYVRIYIDETDILQVDPDKVPIDKLGKPRLLLKDGAFKLNNLESFVHESGVYHYSQGKLVKE